MDLIVKLAKGEKITDEDIATKRLIMDKKEIQNKIDKNRELIERTLQSDVDPVTMGFIIKKLSTKNENLIKQLND